MPSDVCFAATAPGSGREPWASDGTAAGTTQVCDLRPGPNSSSPTWVNLGAWFQLTNVPTPPSWSVLVPLPGDLGMIGTPLIMQAIFFVPSSLSIAGSNGLRLTFGL